MLQLEVARMARAAVTVVAMAGSVLAQEGTPADVAAKLSGTWKLNLELSPSLTAPGRSGGRRGTRGGGLRGGGSSLALGMTALQRGGGGRGGGGLEPVESGADLPPLEAAAQKVLQVFQQIPTDVTIAATATSVTFKDPSGQGTFVIDGKTAALDIAGSQIKVKTKWDGAVLRQEFSTTRRKVIRSWGLDARNLLVLTMRVESLTLNTTELRAVFDRQ
jgi:hypothetical protein